MHPIVADAEVSRITAQLLEDVRLSAEKMVPAFLEEMPKAYFHDLEASVILSHLKAIVANEASGATQEILLRSGDGNTYTFIHERNYRGQLSELVRRLPNDKSLYAAKVYSAKQGERIVDVFQFGEHESPDLDQPAVAALAAPLQAYLTARLPEVDPTDVGNHLQRCNTQYLTKVSPEVFFRDFEAVEAVAGYQAAWVKVLPREDQSIRLHLAVSHTRQQGLIARIARYLGSRHWDIAWANVDTFRDAEVDIAVMNLRAFHPEPALDPEALRQDLFRLCFMDDMVIDLIEDFPDYALLQLELIAGLSLLVHQRLIPVNPYVYTFQKVLHTFLQYPAQVAGVLEAFDGRFSPEKKDSAGEAWAPKAAEVSAIARSEEARKILSAFWEVLPAILKTNAYLPSRVALAFRLDPALIQRDPEHELPYGVFFVAGKGFKGFHVRFRDIARGGIRLVCPRDTAQYTLESERLYDEVLGLAAAQQLKNKDIPEGGAKGVMLVRPGQLAEPCGQAFADALLDLITPDPAVQSWIRDYFGQPETLYLGPDENVSDRLINWMVARAQYRGYPNPNAFMSSKPGAGVNHKQYGVTSEGVIVFLEAALLAAGINPRERSFTLKLTGGPDGDVAGNALKILHREYGTHPRIVGIADGAGALEDPEGLAWDELLRLVAEGLPCTAFDPARLGPEGKVASITQPEGLVARNTLHNRLVADAFIPAGGRPNTLNLDNWKHFLTPEGTPSSPIVVEGANLFISSQARQHLSAAGVKIFKDSSANKCGVICSSYEIIASLLLGEGEFLDIKEQFVEELMVILRRLARMEAATLLREHRRRPGMDLPALSVRLSQAMIRTNDAIAAHFTGLDEPQLTLARNWIFRYLPPVLQRLKPTYILSRLPEPYMQQILATSLSSRIIYREGISYFEDMSKADIAAMAMAYLVQEEETRQWVAAIRASELPDKEKIASLLESGGSGLALRERLG